MRECKCKECPYCDSANTRPSKLNTEMPELQNVPGGGMVCVDCDGYFEIMPHHCPDAVRAAMGDFLERRRK